MQQMPPDECQALYHMLVSVVTFIPPKWLQSKLAESIGEFLQIFEGNYSLISIHITRDGTQGRKQLATSCCAKG